MKHLPLLLILFLLLFLLLFSLTLIALFGIGLSYLLGVEVWRGAIIFAVGYITAAISVSQRKKK